MNGLNEADRLYSEKEAARIWGVAPRTLRSWRSANLIEWTRTPTGRVRYTLDQILAGKVTPVSGSYRNMPPS